MLESNNPTFGVTFLMQLYYSASLQMVRTPLGVQLHCLVPYTAAAAVRELAARKPCLPTCLLCLVRAYHAHHHTGIALLTPGRHSQTRADFQSPDGDRVILTDFASKNTTVIYPSNTTYPHGYCQPRGFGGFVNRFVDDDTDLLVSTADFLVSVMAQHTQHEVSDRQVLQLLHVLPCLTLSAKASRACEASCTWELCGACMLPLQVKAC